MCLLEAVGGVAAVPVPAPGLAKGLERLLVTGSATEKVKAAAMVTRTANWSSAAAAQLVGYDSARLVSDSLERATRSVDHYRTLGWISKRVSRADQTRRVPPSTRYACGNLEHGRESRRIRSSQLHLAGRPPQRPIGCRSSATVHPATALKSSAGRPSTTYRPERLGLRARHPCVKYVPQALINAANTIRNSS